MPSSPIEIGWVQAGLIVDNPTEGELLRDGTPGDRLEALIANVPPPQKSLRSSDSSLVSLPSSIKQFGMSLLISNLEFFQQRQED
jgi:hypothetical protein